MQFLIVTVLVVMSAFVSVLYQRLFGVSAMEAKVSMLLTLVIVALARYIEKDVRS